MGNLRRRYVDSEDPQDGQAGRVRAGALPPPETARAKDGIDDDREVRPGRPRLEHKDQTREALKPWEAAGMSRATFYRRLREARGVREMGPQPI